jgi:hypothetical protein
MVSASMRFTLRVGDPWRRVTLSVGEENNGLPKLCSMWHGDDDNDQGPRRGKPLVCPLQKKLNMFIFAERR